MLLYVLIYKLVYFNIIKTKYIYFLYFFEGFTEDKDIVYVNYNNLIDIFFQNIVNYNLKYNWYVDKSK